MREKRTTLEDIAKALGISKNAVSLALRGKEGVSEQLRARVLDAAQSMRYEGIAQNTGGGCILALIPRYLSLNEGFNFYQQVCFHMEAWAQARGCQLIITSVSETEEEACVPPALLERLPVAGVMTIGNLSQAYCEMINRLGVRYLMVDQYYDSIVASSVTTANTSGAYLLTRHLIDKGHKHIHFFGKRYTTASLNERWEGYCRAMNEAELPVLRNRYMQDRSREFNDRELIRQTMREMSPMPTAFVCGHDMLAVDVVKVLAEQGLHCPEDFSIVGFDDIQNPEALALNLTTYRTLKADIAQMSINHLLDGEPKLPQKIAIFGEVVFRQSVKNI